MSDTVPATVFNAARARKTPPASPRRVPARPMPRPSATKTPKIDAREAPSARSVAISGRRRRTEIETALAIRNAATSSVSEASAFRLKRKARTIRSAVAAERPGDCRVSPAGRLDRIFAAIASRGSPGSSTMSTRSSKPSFPRSLWAVKMSVTRRSPPAARATPVNSRSAATVTARRTPPATIRSVLPASRRWRKAKLSGTKTELGARRLARRAPPAKGPKGPQGLPLQVRLISRTAPPPPRPCPLSGERPPTSAAPVTAGAKEPWPHRKESRSRAATGTPATPVTTKSLRPESEAAASRNDAVTLPLACWMAAAAATPTATPMIGRTARCGRLRAGPETSARKRSRKPCTAETYKSKPYTPRERVSPRAAPALALGSPGSARPLRLLSLRLSLDGRAFRRAPVSAGCPRRPRRAPDRGRARVCRVLARPAVPRGGQPRRARGRPGASPHPVPAAAPVASAPLAAAVPGSTAERKVGARRPGPPSASDGARAGRVHRRARVSTPVPGDDALDGTLGDRRGQLHFVLSGGERDPLRVRALRGRLRDLRATHSLRFLPADSCRALRSRAGRGRPRGGSRRRASLRFDSRGGSRRRLVLVGHDPLLRAPRLRARALPRRGGAGRGPPRARGRHQVQRSCARADARGRRGRDRAAPAAVRIAAHGGGRRRPRRGAP